MAWHRFTHEAFACVEDQAMAIFADDHLEFVSLMLALDGRARRVLLLPSGQHVDRLRSLLQASGIESIVRLRNPGRREMLATTWIDAPSPAAFGRADDQLANTQDCQRDPSHTIETEWVIPTSGTTGEAKLANHTLASLTRTCKTDVTTGNQFRWGSLYSLGSFAGVQVFLQALLSASTLVITEDEQGFGERIKTLVRSGCNALSATASLWRMLLMSDQCDDFKLRQITLGGEICDQGLLDRLAQQFPEARVTQIYASTEAGVGFAVQDKLAGFPSSYLEHCPGGVRLAISEHDTLLISPNDAAIGQWIDSDDLVALQGDRVTFQGRRGGDINVGGKKVLPHIVEAALLSVDGIEMARAYAKQNAFSGQVVAAEVVTACEFVGDSEGIILSAMKACRRLLAPHQVPVAIDLVDSIPISPNGKTLR
ncbi:MAG: class I adenylate-forming enzyme family protein [Planctomycetota bacterium]